MRSLLHMGLRKLTKELTNPRNHQMLSDKALEITKARFRTQARRRLIRSKHALVRTVGKQL
jgi:hypothetical protein